MKSTVLDLRTLSFVLMLVTAFLSVTMCFIWRIQRTYSGFGWWTIANLVAAIGFLFLSLRGTAPDYLSIVLGNCLAVGSNLLCLEGNRKFLRLGSGKWFSVGLLAAYAPLMIYFTYADNSVIIRIAVSSLFIGIISAHNWFIFNRSVQNQTHSTYRFARLTYFSFTLLMILRIAGTYAFSDINDFYAPDAIQSITYLIFTGFAILWTFQYLVLNNERMQQELQAAQVELEKLATIDFLTGFHNRRNFFEIGKSEIQRAKRFRHPLAVVMFDLDYFKQVNDTYGHAAGDLVLTEIADVCRKSLRGTDVLGRLGGEEFAVLLPHTKLSDAQTVAEHLRAVIEANATEFFSETIKITASFGVSDLTDYDEEIEIVLAKADALLFQAKRRGRNQVAADFSGNNSLKLAAV
ncbi:MAG: GGDEF domain-containing protein [Pyrinomonadaceae bacterium]|nr:GGDEF domain-containing protein [Pyrinomonadaceae bacterium]